MTRLWEDTRRIPETLSRTLRANSGIHAVADALRGPGVERIVISGNGAAWHAGFAVWLASLETGADLPPIVCLPAGFVARGRFSWRAGDILFAVSSSGEFRDIAEAVTAPRSPGIVAITADPTSTLALAAREVALARLPAGGGFTHSSAYAANVALGLAVLAAAARDETLNAALAALPDAAEAAVRHAEAWDVADAIGPSPPRMVLSLGDGPAWAAALEASLLVREVAALPADAAELREGMTSSMFGVGDSDLALLLQSGRDGDVATELEAEAATILGGRGARVVAVPGAEQGDARLAAVLAFPASVRAAIRLAEIGALNPDAPSSAGTYHATSRIVPDGALAGGAAEGAGAA